MNKVFQSIIITLMSAMIPFFSSCSDDDSVNEWDMSYVSLLPADYLRPTPSFTLKHVEEEGIEGSVEFQFMATTQKAVTQDINVHYSVTCDGIDANKINLSAKNLLIKAGSTASEPITLSRQVSMPRTSRHGMTLLKPERKLKPPAPLPAESRLRCFRFLPTAQAFTVSF